MKSGAWWRGNGEEVEEFEKEFSAYHSCSGAIAVTNGTNALELALTALGIGEGDEVIFPAFTFLSTAIAILNVNAVPVPVDIDDMTFNISPKSVADAISNRTRAVIPVHMSGQMADMDALVKIAKTNSINIVEDAAHAQGASWRGLSAGSLGDAGTFSFQAFKLMTAGEGGAIVSTDLDLLEKLFLHGNCGRSKTDRHYNHTVLGSNYRMSEFQASILRTQLKRLDSQIEVRNENSHLLKRMFDGIDGVSLQEKDERVTRNPHYMVLFRYNSLSFNGLSRDRFVELLQSEGIPASVAYKAVHKTPLFQDANFEPRIRHSLGIDYRDVECPSSERLSSEGVWIHHSVLLGSEKHISQIADAILKIQYHCNLGRHLVGVLS